MTAINYTAKRNFVVQGLDVSDIDIFIAAADDSFNSTTTDLSGMLSGDWIYVTGSAVDDGWHQLTADSTTNKITTSSALTNESAGSAISIVGYKHGLDEAYDLETYPEQLNKDSKGVTQKAESLSGVVETLLFRETEYWNIRTGFITADELPYWEEFFSSIRAGEEFILDPYGTIAVADDAKTCILVGDYNVSRIDTTLVHNITFRAQVV